MARVSVTFPGPVKAVRDVSLQIRQQEVVALVGPNGAGKTTLLDVALGLQSPSAGSARLLGMDPYQAKRRGLIGVVNQTGALPADYKVGELLTVFHGFYDAPLDVPEVLALAHLDSLRGRRIGKLSGGEQQRVRLALALLPDPLILFLDEPTAGMDPVARQEFWRVMTRAVGQGKTVLFATHYLAEAESYAERTVIMHDGKIVADAPTSQLLQRGLGELQIEVPLESFRVVEESLRRPEWNSQWDSGILTVRGRNLDDAARTLLKAPGARHLRVADSSLEDAFAAIALGRAEDTIEKEQLVGSGSK